MQTESDLILTNLTKEFLKIASLVTIPHEAINTIEDEKEIRAFTNHYN